MMRRALTALALAAAAAVPTVAQAQYAYYLGSARSDTAVGMVVNADATVPVRFYNPNGYYYYLSTTALTFHYDPALIEISGISTGPGQSIVDTTRAAGTFSVISNGCTSGIDAQPFQLHLKLKPGATQGGYMWMQVDSTRLFYYCYLPYGAPFAIDAITDIAQVCAATQMYGDVDLSARVDSRDALITLSAAVGLPAVGFNLAAGDVDSDGLTNSRDALIMLSHSIGLYTGASRISQGVPTDCPLLAAPGEDVVFRRDAATDSIYVMASGSYTPVPVPNATGAVGLPRLAANGTSIVYYCEQGGYGRICTIESDGSNAFEVTNQFSVFENYTSPDWSPDGTKIGMLLNGYPYRVDPDGTSRIPLNGDCCSSYLTYNRLGAAVAYNADGGDVAIAQHDGTGQVYVTTGFSDAYMLRYTVAGDSLLITRSSQNGLWKVATTGGTARRVVSITGLRYQGGFDIGPQGILFAIDTPPRRGLWLMAPGGQLVRLTGGNDIEPSFRRNP